jgi:hypothetical protein
MTGGVGRGRGERGACLRCCYVKRRSLETAGGVLAPVAVRLGALRGAQETAMRRGLACSALGTTIDRTPFSNLASTLSGLTWVGSANDRVKVP